MQSSGPVRAGRDRNKGPGKGRGLAAVGYNSLAMMSIVSRLLPHMLIWEVQLPNLHIPRWGGMILLIMPDKYLQKCSRFPA